MSILKLQARRNKNVVQYNIHSAKSLLYDTAYIRIYAAM